MLVTKLPLFSLRINNRMTFLRAILVCLGLIVQTSMVIPVNGSAASPQVKIKRLDGSEISTSEIEQTVARLMREAHVTGLNVAILNDNKIVYVKSFGFRNKEENKL